MKVLSLFSGIGVFDLALENAGFEIDSVCEINKNSQDVLRRHFPGAKLYDDVRKVGKDTHVPGSIDLICGGPPCQDFSVAGKRQGIGGERSGLWFEFARIIDELGPRWVIFENVPGLFSSWTPIDDSPREVEVHDFDTREEAERWARGVSDDWVVEESSDFETIVAFFQQHGYGVAWRTFDSQFFGVPQRRRRIFLVASLGNGSCCEVLFERECLPGNLEPGKAAGQVSPTVPDVSPTLRGEGHDASEDGSGRRALIPDVARPLAFGKTTDHQDESQQTYIAFDWQSGGDVRQGVSDKPMLQANQVPAVAAFDGAQVTSKESRLRIQPGLPAPTLNSEGRVSVFMAGQGEKAGGLGVSETITPTLKGSASGLNQVPSIALSLTASPTASPTASGRLDPSAETFIAETFPTLDTSYAEKQGSDQQVYKNNAAGLPIIGGGVRRLTPTECERLQGVPDGWTAWGINEKGNRVEQSDSVRYQQLGNAVTRQPVEWIAKRIWRIEHGELL